MRYTVLTFRTFHHRITRYLGVLVGAALVATLGLPSAVQAQTPNPPMPKYDAEFGHVHVEAGWCCIRVTFSPSAQFLGL